jgi:hypothetical protein
MNNIENLYKQFTGLFYGIVLFLNIDKDVFNFLIGAIIINILSALIKVSLIDSLSFSFKKLSSGFKKKLTVLLLVLAVAYFLKALGYVDTINLTTNFMKLLIASEGLSTWYNLKSAYTTKEQKPEDYISIILFKISKLIDLMFKKVLNKIFGNDCIDDDNK